MKAGTEFNNIERGSVSSAMIARDVNASAASRGAVNPLDPAKTAKVITGETIAGVFAVNVRVNPDEGAKLITIHTYDIHFFLKYFI